MPVSIAGIGLAAAGAIGKGIAAHDSNEKLQQLLGNDPVYTANPLAAQRLGLAQQLLNARQPGAIQAQRNIQGAQGANNASIERNATSGSQAIAAEAAGQGTTDQNFDKLDQNEAAGYQQRYQDLAGAQQASIEEGQKVHQDQVRRFEDTAQIEGAQQANTNNQWGSLTNLGLGVANYGLAMNGSGGNGSSQGRRRTNVNPLDQYNNMDMMQYPPWNTPNNQIYTG